MNRPEKAIDPGIGVVAGLRKRVAELELELRRANSQIETLDDLLQQNRHETGFTTPKNSSPEQIRKVRSMEVSEPNSYKESLGSLKREESPLRNVYKSLVEKIDEIRKNGSPHQERGLNGGKV